MLKAIIGDHLWAEMSEAQKVDAVLNGHATLKQMSEGLLYGSEEMRRACQNSLAHTGPSFDNLPVDADEEVQKSTPAVKARSRSRKKKKQELSSHIKQRFGLPEGFVPRFQRYGRSVLLELNVYRLPDGQEFIPSRPAGTLGSRQHLYALLTTEQYLDGKRGSVYIRHDGRIFDYSVDSNPVGDFFDTGYTIYDLERTGRYAPSPRKKRKTAPKVKRAVAAG